MTSKRISDIILDGSTNLLRVRVIRIWLPFRRSELCFLFVDKHMANYIYLARIKEIEVNNNMGWYYESCTKSGRTRKAYPTGDAITCLEHGVIEKQHTGTISKQQ